MRILLLFLFSCFLCSGLYAQATWTGTTSSNWSLGANWSTSIVPDHNTSVIIPYPLSVGAVYPTLTATVEVKGLAMIKGSVLHMGGYTLTDSGSVFIDTATIDGGGAINVINSVGVSVKASTFTTDSFKVINYSTYCRFWDNTITGNTTIADASTNNSADNSIDGNVFNGDLTLIHAASGVGMYEGGSGPSTTRPNPTTTGNHITGNATFTLFGGSFYSSYTNPIRVDGNLTVSRLTHPNGGTNLFNCATGTPQVSGDFSLTSISGPTEINMNNPNTVTIGGKINISATTQRNFFYMRHMKNTIATGSSILITGANNVELRNDTLKAPVSITGYYVKGEIYDNYFINRTTTISDSTGQTGTVNNIDGNLFEGDLILSHNSGIPMWEGKGSLVGGNHIKGNAMFNITESSSFYSSNDHPIQVDSSFTINRTVGGATYLFVTTPVTTHVKGKFSFTTPGGSTEINRGNTNTVVFDSTVNISATSAGTSFYMHQVRNITAAGSAVSVSGASPLEIVRDTLRADVSLTGYGGYCVVYNNSVTGSTAIADASTNTNITNNIDGNLFMGNLTLTHNATSAMYEGGNGSSPSTTGNSITGNAAFNITSTGAFYSSHTHGIKVDGNLTVNRSASGLTYLFDNPAATTAVGGNFSYNNTANTGSSTYINRNAMTTGMVIPIGGAIDITATTLTRLEMYRLKNLAAGGNINVTGPGNLIIRNDSLLANVNITGYSGLCNIYDNSITGNTLIADAPGQNVGSNYIDGNLFDGRFTLVHSSTGTPVSEGMNSPSGNGNTVTGIDSIVNVAGATTLNLGVTHVHRADSTFILNAPLSSGASRMAITNLMFGGSTPGRVRQLNNDSVRAANVFLSKTGSARLFLDSSMSITTAMTFTSGYVVSSALHPLMFADNATHTGAGDASHVIKGAVVKTGTQAFTFPLGDGTTYHQCGITAPAATTRFRAEYRDTIANAAGYDIALKDVTIGYVSPFEYWLIDRVAGTSNIKVILSHNRINSGVIRNRADLRVAHWYGSQWHNEGNGGVGGTDSIGTAQSDSTISTFSPFALSVVIGGAPLPLKLISFNALKAGNAAQINWQTAYEKNIAHFSVERSSDGITFRSIGHMAATNTATGNTYRYYDTEPMTGVNHYRLAIVDGNGTVTYSDKQKLNFGNTEGSISLAPNPAKDVLYIRGLGAWGGAILKVRNLNGQLLQRSLLTGEQEVSLHIAAWPTGLYSIEIGDDVHQRVLRTFIKE